MDLTSIAEHHLSAKFGAAVRLGVGELLEGSPRSTVTRMPVLTAPGAAPATVIVKQSIPLQSDVDKTDEVLGPAWRLVNEWVGLLFLEELAGATSPAPRLYGGDLEAGILVLEDLGAGQRPEKILMQTDPCAAERILMEYAAALGRMHGLTCGYEAEFERVAQSVGRHKTLLFDLEEFIYAFCGVTAEMGVPAGPECLDQLQALSSRISGPGPFRAYVHHDPCLDNGMLTAAGFKFLDFEFGGFGNALTDGAYGRAMFPTCWCVGRLPEPVMSSMEREYRQTLAVGCPEAADDLQFGRALVDACAAHVLAIGDLRFLIGIDRDWGNTTRRQRVLVLLDLVSEMTEAYNWMEAMGAFTRKVATALRQRWQPSPDEPQGRGVHLFPAFRTNPSG